MEQFIERLKNLFTLRLDDRVQFHIGEIVPGSERIGGYIVWAGFDGLPQRERQCVVWKALRDTLLPTEQQHVSAILTLTPHEEQGIKENEEMP